MLEFLDFVSLRRLSESFDLQRDVLALLQAEKFNSVFLQDYGLVPEPEWTDDIQDIAWTVCVNYAKDNSLSLYYEVGFYDYERDWRDFSADIILLDRSGNALLLVLCSDLSVHFLAKPKPSCRRHLTADEACDAAIDFYCRVISEAERLRDQVADAINEYLPIDQIHPVPRDKLTALLGRLSLFALQKLHSQVLVILDDTHSNLTDTYRRQEIFRKIYL
jgi:hypothetical protein